MLRTVKISDKGQIAIPKVIQKSFGISKGDELVLVEIGNKLVLEKLEETKKKFEDGFKDLLIHSQKSLSKLWNNKEDEVWDKV